VTIPRPGPQERAKRYEHRGSQKRESDLDDAVLPSVAGLEEGKLSRHVGRVELGVIAFDRTRRAATQARLLAHDTEIMRPPFAFGQMWRYANAQVGPGRLAAAFGRDRESRTERPVAPSPSGLCNRVETGSGGRIRTYDQAVNSRPLYH
jgi:hypothetical protein